MAERWKGKGRGAVADIQADKSAFYTGRIEGITALAADGVEPMRIYIERW